MVNKINNFTLSAAIYLIIQSLWILPANSSGEPQVPRLTFRIPRSNTPLPSPSPPFAFTPEQHQEMRDQWAEELVEPCFQENARAGGKPFGISKARYYLISNQERPSLDNSVIMVVGCITNNSGRIIDENTIEVFFQCPALKIPNITMSRVSSFSMSRHFSGLAAISSDPSLPIGFFAFYLPPSTSTTTCFIEQPSPPDQTETYIPVERLDITIVR